MGDKKVIERWGVSIDPKRYPDEPKLRVGNVTLLSDWCWHFLLPVILKKKEIAEDRDTGEKAVKLRITIEVVK